MFFSGFPRIRRLLARGEAGSGPEPGSGRMPSSVHRRGDEGEDVRVVVAGDDPGADGRLDEEAGEGVLGGVVHAPDGLRGGGEAADLVGGGRAAPAEGAGPDRGGADRG